MELLIWAGAALTLGGLAGLVWCIMLVLRAKREKLDDAAMKTRLQSLVALNLGALALSALGLMLVVAGVVLA